MPSALLVTCAALPAGDDDGELLVTALARQGVGASWQSWDAPGADWASDIVVIRSPWNYTLRREAFLTWAESVPTLANPAGVIRWNSDKTYLGDLDAEGVPIVPSTFAAPGETAQFPDEGEIVVKPAVGAGSQGAGRFDAGNREGARQHVATLHAAGRTALIQPYVSQVDASGETALIFLNGVFSHAVSKAAMLPVGAVHGLRSDLDTSLFVEERITPHTATADELRVGEQAMAALRSRFGTDLLYARVDLLPGLEGPVVVELEVTEPSLFLEFDPGSADRFAAAIASTVAAGVSAA